MGMQVRILAGYDYIAENYKPGDEIFIFGFSRGAHQARALAGLIAYAGVPKNIGSNAERQEKYTSILKMLKDIRDDEYERQWKTWSPNQTPLLADKIKNDTDLNLDMQTAEIKFLGVWDTVPGSSFANYTDNPCRENIGFVKRYLFWLPMISKGERYKSGSYPPKRNIAHAVALDEKRSKFAPLFLCKAINEKFTTPNETWFPGAHADVGGGYGDNDLPNISLNWMIGLLGNHYKFTLPLDPNQTKGNPEGLAHWSFGDKYGNTGSDCEDRPKLHPPLGYDPLKNNHESIKQRTKSGVAPIQIRGMVNYNDWKYPILCPGPGK